MKISILALTLGVAALCSPYAEASAFVNLTPTPKQMTVGDGELVLPSSFQVASSGLDDEMKAEITKFATSLKKGTGIVVTEGADGLFSVTKDESVPEEGYRLSVKAGGVSIAASSAAGLYYAFQTIKKVLPANVMAEMDGVGPYALPVMEINDEPRYVHRGYELDCARHFFDVDQVKRMLDVMSYYKMNRFHWHLTDDQGWRIEIPKYPKLIEVAATAPNAYWWDFDNHYEYYLNRPYGPQYFTVSELKEVVAYAKERHIEVIPEVDMPGHMEAAIAAYPQMSTNPQGEYKVRYWPGVSTNILDISNPAVMQFCRDVMDELVEIFPYEYIHIGGDECPKSAWASSASIQAMKSELGISTDNALQSWFSKQIADYVKPKGKKLICWNEVLTSEGADPKMVQEADIMIYDWLGGTAADGPSYKAAKLGLRSVWCSTYHYYIDYSQWSGSSEPKSMSGPITLETVYNTQPSTTTDPALLPLYYGVQCNLWTEYIAEPAHVEYNSLPRMIAVAETGWSPQSKKNFTDFKKRFNADTRLLDLRGFTYGKHYVDNAGVEPDVVYPEEGAYYRLITRASHDTNRKDRCIELVRDGSPLVSEKSATVGQLWTNTQVDEGNAAYDWQYWTFEPDPAGSGKFAMVCRAVPGGSVNPAMIGSSVSAHWKYDNSVKNYNFVLGQHFGKEESSYYYSIRSDKGDSWWLNCAQAAQNQTVNNWNDPADGNGGIWLFSGEDTADEIYPEFDFFEKGSQYVIYNTDADFGQAHIGDNGAGDKLAWCADGGYEAWVIEESVTDKAHNIQYVTLRNNATGRYIAGVAAEAVSSTPGISFFSGDAGYPVLMSDSRPAEPNVRIVRWEGHDDFALSINGRNFYPLSAGSMVNPGTVSAGSTTAGNAVRNQSATWSIHKAEVLTLECVDTDGNHILTAEISHPVGSDWIPSADITDIFPAPANFVYKSHTATSTGYRVVYERTAWTLTYECRLAGGTLIDRVHTAAPVGKATAVKAPEVPYFKFEKMADGSPASVTPTADVTVTAVYSTDAHIGVRDLADPVSKLEDGHSYVLYDADPRGGGRNVYRYATSSNAVMGSSSCRNTGSNYIWIAEASGSNFKFKNAASGLYVPAVFTSGGSNLIYLSEQGEPFVCTYDASAENWRIKNSSNDLYWDGNTDGSLSGWGPDRGQPVEIFEFTAAPLYEVTVTEVDEKGAVLLERSVEIAAGSEFLFAASLRPGREILDIDGNEGLDCVTAHKTITVKYGADTGINEISASDSAVGPATGIYDLNGRRLRAISRPGVYIVNGRKVLVCN
ncbi:MAG: beta-N-acetylhexosaminidase [Muribaculaceae bacterium]|nr:beta-N-acetylhexosaminidase [Muribaculaceae bacterium]